MTINPWAVNPAWQNFSSLYREVATAREMRTGMERSHHLTAALYFGIAALEAFLNGKMREQMKATHSEVEIFDKLRKGKILKKLTRWPEKLLGKPLDLDPATMELLTDINDIRGDLTHPKTSGHDIYAKLEAIDADAVVAAVSEYIVKFHEAANTRYPYWIFGWNYLNPRPNAHEIFIINDQQFCFSLQAMGVQIPAGDHWKAEAWRDLYLKRHEGYKAVREALTKLNRCEPKFDRFPFKPVLCRRWWTSEHQKSCGHVTDESVDFARNYGA